MYCNNVQYRTGSEVTRELSLQWNIVTMVGRSYRRRQILAGFLTLSRLAKPSLTTRAAKVPQFHEVILAGSGESMAVRAEGDLRWALVGVQCRE